MAYIVYPSTRRRTITPDKVRDATRWNTKSAIRIPNATEWNTLTADIVIKLQLSDFWIYWKNLFFCFFVNLFFCFFIFSFSNQKTHCVFFLSLYSEGGIPVLSLKKRLNEVCSLNPNI